MGIYQNTLVATIVALEICPSFELVLGQHVLDQSKYFPALCLDGLYWKREFVERRRGYCRLSVLNPMELMSCYPNAFLD